MAGDPLGSPAGPGLGGHPADVPEAGPPSVLVGDFAAWPPLGSGPGMLVRFLVASDPVMCGDPGDGDLIVSAQDARADLCGRDGEALSRVDGVRSYPVGGGCGIRKDGVPAAALLALVQDAERPIDGVCLRVEYLLVRA